MGKENSYKTYYNLELPKLINKINKGQAKKVVLQFPDGLKYFSKQVVDELRNSCKNTQFFIYFGSCFGACDIPLHLKQLDFDLCVQWGHSVYIKRKDMW